MISTLLRRAVTALLTTASLLAAVAGPATAATAAAADTSDCVARAVFQPFASFKDTNWYFLAPGGDFSTPSAAADAGWQLAGGAAVVSTAQADGSDGYVLDLPSKAVAVSPPMCITTDYPRARMSVRNVVGGEGVQFSVSYAGTPTWLAPKTTGQVHGGAMQWQAAAPINLQPTKTSGWQVVRFTFVAGGTKSRFQVDDVWVDPRMR
jgi:hypothetical protein